MKADIGFTGQRIDRQDHVRADPGRLQALRTGGDALLLDLDGLNPVLTDDDCLSWSALAPADASDCVFLGLLDGRPAFARVPETGDMLPAYAQRDIFALISRLRAQDMAIYGGARSLVDWHARHRFCANCGAATQLAKGGWQRDCSSCGAQHFPRTDPVAIMLVEYNGDLLLGRQSRFPPRSYSALAGFIEPGETIEQAVAREVLEEAGVVCGDVRYIASQPWPFPSQLMIGCHARAQARDLTVDHTELEDARWFTRAQIAEALDLGTDSPDFVPPPHTAIAHSLLRWWLEETA